MVDVMGPQGARSRMKALFLAFCLFWGIPCVLPIPSKHHAAFVRASARARRKARLLQSLPICILMAPFLAVHFATTSKLVLLLMLYLIVPYILFIVPICGDIGARLASDGVLLRHEFARWTRDSGKKPQ